MSHDPHRAILDARAKKLRERGNDLDTRRLRERVLVVEIGSEVYGLPVAQLREVVRATPVSSLPGLPPFVQGIAGVRGELLAVIDVGELHGVGKTGNANFFAVLEAGRRAVAMRVEAVRGFRDVYEDEIVEGLAQPGGALDGARTITNDFVHLLDVEALLGGDRLVVGATVPNGTRP